MQKNLLIFLCSQFIIKTLFPLFVEISLCSDGSFKVEIENEKLFFINNNTMNLEKHSLVPLVIKRFCSNKSFTEKITEYGNVDIFHLNQQEAVVTIPIIIRNGKEFWATRIHINNVLGIEMSYVTPKEYIEYILMAMHGLRRKLKLPLNVTQNCIAPFLLPIYEFVLEEELMKKEKRHYYENGSIHYEYPGFFDHSERYSRSTTEKVMLLIMPKADKLNNTDLEQIKKSLKQNEH